MSINNTINYFYRKSDPLLRLYFSEALRTLNDHLYSLLGFKADDITAEFEHSPTYVVRYPASDLEAIYKESHSMFGSFGIHINSMFLCALAVSKILSSFGIKDFDSKLLSDLAIRSNIYFDDNTTLRTHYDSIWGIRVFEIEPADLPGIEDLIASTYKVIEARDWLKNNLYASNVENSDVSEVVDTFQTSVVKFKEVFFSNVDKIAKVLLRKINQNVNKVLSQPMILAFGEYDVLELRDVYNFLIGQCQQNAKEGINTAYAVLGTAFENRGRMTHVAIFQKSHGAICGNLYAFKYEHKQEHIGQIDFFDRSLRQVITKVLHSKEIYFCSHQAVYRLYGGVLSKTMVLTMKDLLEQGVC